ncbi:hypothetical protein A6A26_15280 [Pantoea sp. OXWO6B1]|nr:hypothetical protein A6A26_15280 [Pantoea sp. OXWO6B1]
MSIVIKTFLIMVSMQIYKKGDAAAISPGLNETYLIVLIMFNKNIILTGVYQLKSGSKKKITLN